MFQVAVRPVEADGRGGSRESRAERSTAAEMMQSVANKKERSPQRPVIEGRSAAELAPQMQSDSEISQTCRKAGIRWRKTWPGRHICQGRGPLNAVCVHLPAGVPGSWLLAAG
jgi:hypothetical protein